MKTIKGRILVAGNRVGIETEIDVVKIFAVNKTFQKRIVNYINKHKIIIENKKSFTWGGQLLQ